MKRAKMTKRSHHGDRRLTQTETLEKQENKDSGKNHCNDDGEVPGYQLDQDLKEISGEGYCDNVRFLDPGDRALETFCKAAAPGKGLRA